MGKSRREHLSRKFNDFYDEEFGMKDDMRQARNKEKKLLKREQKKQERLGDKQIEVTDSHFE